MGQKEVERLLKQGAYSLLEEDDGAEAQAFCEGDIDDILNERSRVRKIEAITSWLNKDKKRIHQGSTTFTSSSADANVDVAVDDPNFWAKVMPGMKNSGTCWRHSRS